MKGEWRPRDRMLRTNDDGRPAEILDPNLYMSFGSDDDEVEYMMWLHPMGNVRMAWIDAQHTSMGDGHNFDEGPYPTLQPLTDGQILIEVPPADETRTQWVVDTNGEITVESGGPDIGRIADSSGGPEMGFWLAEASMEFALAFFGDDAPMAPIRAAYADWVARSKRAPEDHKEGRHYE